MICMCLKCVFITKLFRIELLMTAVKVHFLILKIILDRNIILFIGLGNLNISLKFEESVELLLKNYVLYK